MIDNGRPLSCLTCKRQKLKCDRIRPTCARCVRAKKCCEWPKPVLRFVDLNEAVAARHVSSRAQSRIETSIAINRTLHDDTETQALAFFMRHYFLDAVPDGRPNPGLFGFVMPAISSPRISAVATSLSAVALTIYSRWRMDRSVTATVSKVLGQAIKSLSHDLQEQNLRQTDATLLTTLLLQFHATFEALIFSKRYTIVHHLGALALVKEFGHPSTWSAIASEFVDCIIHLEVTAAIREQRVVNSEVRYWRSVIESISINPSRYLDTLGIQVADMQFRASLLSGDATRCLSSTEIYTLLNDIQQLDECLILWQEQVSTFWGPFSWTAPGLIFPPIQTFQGLCHVYTSITAARRINDWRSYRLTLALISLRLTNRQEGSGHDVQMSSAGQTGAFVLLKRIQWLVDGICASVPFCLGNRSIVGTISDFVDPALKFPTCHDMPKMYGLHGRPADPIGLEPMSSHQSHALTQGSWLMLSNLALLIRMSLNKETLTSLFPLKDGQLTWICQQYLRNLSLNSIIWTQDNSLTSKILTGVDLPPAMIIISEASRCMKR